MTLLQIRLFGDFQLRYQDRQLCDLHQPRLQSLLAYLLLNRHTPQSRQQLGALASTSNVFTGVAQTLVRNGLPAAVAMQAEITDQAAIDLAGTFYQALANGYPVDAALTQARVTLASKRSAEWAIPVLFSRSPDNRLFDLRTVLPSPDCPYPGMAPFIESQAEAFFGRNQEIADAVERLRQHPFLSIAGPSGSGKSSLAYAGIIPALRQTKRFGAGQWLLKNMRPGANPLTRLLTTLDTSPERIADLAFAERTLLLIDQFEELFTQADEDEGQHFIAVLQTLVARPNLYILLTVRADFYPELMALPLWDLIKANRLELTPLGDEELRAAILEPAAQVGVTVDEALVERLVADAAGEAGVLPLLQETLVLLWEQVEQRHLGLAAYAVLGEGKRSGLQVAINRRADITYNNLSAEAQTIARRIFLRLVQFGEGRADTRRQLPEAALHAAGDAKLFDQTLQHVANSRLLTLSGEEQDETRRVDIAHEALITSWEQLQSWIQGRREAEQIRRRLEGAAERFAALAHQGGFLDVVELHEAEQWLQSAESSELGVSDSLQLLIRQSHAKQRRNAVTRYASVALIVLLAVVAAGIYLSQQNQVIDEQRKAATVQAKALATIEVQATRQAMAAATIEVQATAEAVQRRQAERQSKIALARQLASQTLASLELKQDIELSLLLAVEAAKSAYAAGEQIQQVDDALRRVLMQAPLAILHHKAAVTDVIFSPDGSRLATQSRDHIVRLWDSATGKELAHFQHSDLVYSIYFSPDGSRLATENWDDTAYLVDSVSGKELARLQCENKTDPTVVFSPDGSRWVFTCYANTVQFWDSVNGKELAVLQHQGYVSRIVFSPDSSRLATGSYDDTVRLWDSVTGKELAVLQHEDDVNEVVFSPNGNQLATASKDDTVRLWESATGKELVVFRHEDDVDRVIFSSDGLRLASASRDHAVWLWDTTVRVWNSEGSQEPVLMQHLADVNRVVFSPDGSRLASKISDGSIQLWDITNGEKLAYLNQQNDVKDIMFSQDGSLLITINQSNSNRLWDSASGNELIVRQSKNDIFSTAVSLDGSHVATLGRDNIVRLWDRVSGELLVELQHNGAVLDFDFSPDGSRLATGGEDNTAYLVDSASGKMVASLPHEDNVWDIAFNPDGSRLATLSADNSIWLWDSTNGQRLAHIPHEDNQWGVLFSPDGSRLANLIQGKGVWLWDSTNGEVVGHFQPGHTVAKITMNDDGSRLAIVFTDKSAHLFDSISGREFNLQYKDSVSQVIFTPDGIRLATVGEDTSVRLWDSATGQLLFKLPQGSVQSIVFSPDGSRLVTVNADHGVQLWDSNTGQILARLPHNADVGGIAFSPDGSHLTTMSGSTVRLWRPNISDLALLACRILTRDLTQAEWSEHFGSTELYHPTCAELPWPG